MAEILREATLFYGSTVSDHVSSLSDEFGCIGVWDGKVSYLAIQASFPTPLRNREIGNSKAVHVHSDENRHIWREHLTNSADMRGVRLCSLVEWYIVHPRIELRESDLTIYTVQGRWPEQYEKCAIEIMHRPSGIKVMQDQWLSQWKNKRAAMKKIEQAVLDNV